MAASTQENISSTREAMDALLEISKLLNTGLDAETMSICVRLCENGANPEALVRVIQELRRETAAIKANLSTKSAGSGSTQ
ncbi:mitotic-spindle organizing protein 1-like [Tubulanus polymorphus]|uniref:mitotic-spindle organizing protein 1-like n=1 Tax=Tubulanus polymorphus TaxID=672921 RepID=UPI003DA4B85A